ncbi:MAG: RNA polymerase sigma factor [Gemmatimonadota bacterium]
MCPRIRRTTADEASPDSDSELLDRARGGEERAFRLLVERYEPRIASVVTAMLGPGDDAEDVGQETFIRFYRSIDRFRGEASLGTYLTRIAINLSRNALRRGRRQAARFASRGDLELRGSEPAIEAEDEVEGRELRRRVRRAVDRLDGKHRAVVVLRMMEGYSTKETAAILEIAEGTVLSRLSRAMRKLEADLGPEERQA